MPLGPRSPCPSDDCDGFTVDLRSGDCIAHALAELEALAWIGNHQIAAMLIGAARLALRDAAPPRAGLIR